MEESDEVTFSGEETVVPTDKVIGSLVGFALTDDDITMRGGSVGKKRVQRLSLVSTGTSTGGTFGAAVILGTPHSAPVA